MISKSQEETEGSSHLEEKSRSAGTAFKLSNDLRLRMPTSIGIRPWVYAVSPYCSVIVSFAPTGARANGTSTMPWRRSCTSVQTSAHWSQSQ
jgi:hypothetical protein